MNLTAIIVDDEISSINTLKKYLSQIDSSIHIVSETTDFTKAIELINLKMPDILLLDIDLGAGKTGFDLLKNIHPYPYKVIFITAHNDFALQAFKCCAIDYLLKPIDSDDLTHAISKVKELVNGTSFSLQLKELISSMQQKKKPERIFLKTSDAIIAAEINNIIRLVADGSYTEVYLKDKKKIVVSKNIKEFEDLLPEPDFFRPHQSHLINMNFFEEFKKGDGGYIVLKDGSSIPVSTRKKQFLMDLLK